MSADRILSQLLGSGVATGLAGGLAGGLASGLLTSKAGRSVGKKALKLGGAAAVGGLAYAAWDRYRNAAGPNAAQQLDARTRANGSELERFIPTAGQGGQAEELAPTLLMAMIAAAQADGRLDRVERQAIGDYVRSLDLSESEKTELIGRIEHPVDMHSLVAAASTPEIAAEIYTASVLAIDVDSAAERAYLAMLAARLGLADGLVESIHRELGVTGSCNETPALQRLAS